MATFGKFEVVTELYSGERGAVFSARPAGGGREIKYAVKVFNPSSLDLDEQFWESQSFTERARVQQRTAEAGGSHWAPIYEIGTSPAGTYYITDFHPLSAASLVTGRVDISAGVLYSIVQSVVAGLGELKAAAGRAHGNLKGSNILINSRGDVAVAGAVLSDPASAPEAARAGEAGDLYALGELIHLLVLGERSRGGGAWPLGPARGWSRLGGRQGRQWLKLCNDLLSPDPSARPQGLDAVGKRVCRLVPRRARPSRRLSLAVAAAVVVIAAGAAAVLGLRDAGARKQVCAAKAQWAGGLTAALADPKRRSLLQSDPDLLRVVRELDQADLASFDCDRSAGRLGFNPDLRNFRQTQSTLDAVRRAERGLSPIQWRQLARAAELQGKFEARGWKQPARHLADCITGARPGSEDLAAGIERFLRVMAAVDHDTRAVEERWVTLQTKTRDLEGTRDPYMKAFAAHLRGAAASSVELTDAGFGSLAGVVDASDRAGRLSEVQKQLGQHYDEDRFKEEVVATIPLNALQATHIDRYLSGMAAYKVQEEAIKSAVADLKAQAEENQRLVHESGIEENQEKQFRDDLDRVRWHILTFGERKFIPRDFEAGEFDTARRQVERRVASLKGFVRMEDLEEWLDKLEPLGAASAALNQHWEQWKEDIAATATQLAGQRPQIQQLQQDTRRLAQVLFELDQEVPQVPEELKDPVLMEAAKRKREAVLASLFADRTPINLARQPGAVNLKESATVQTARTSFEQWLIDLADLGEDFRPLRQRILTPDIRPDEKWASAKPGFWNDRIVQTVVAQDVKRLQRLRALGEKSRDELVKVAQNERWEELALHAWRLLGSHAQPAWPTRAGELAAEAALRRRLSELLAEHTRTDESARRAAREISDDAPRRWRRFAEAAGIDEAMLASAVELRDAFGVGPEQFASLTPEIRFNLSLVEARRHLGDPSNQHLPRVITQLASAAGELKDRTVAADLGRRLARIHEKEPFAEAARGDEFTLRPPGTEVQIAFKRVKREGQRPFFLAMNEVSFAQFAGVAETALAWDDLRSLVWSPQPGEIGDPRKGPRSWEWVMRPAPRMYAPQWWLFPEDANDFPTELRDPSAGRFNRTVLSEAAGGNPSDRHPVQYVTPEAAMYFASLVGCRLPTPAEWRAAYDAHEKAVPTGDWNLRDQTWQVQRRHVGAALPDSAAAGAGNDAPHAPDEGIFLPEQPKAATGAAAKALPHRDDTLFFRPVDAAGGGTFRHLVGNVAELVCEASEPFERLKDRRPQGLKAFAAEAASELFVIGGSALSPPEAPLDVPLPVKPGAAFADVGFRLAFTAPSRNLAEKLEWVLAGQGFVQPGAESKTASAEKAPPS